MLGNRPKASIVGVCSPDLLPDFVTSRRYAPSFAKILTITMNLIKMEMILVRVIGPRSKHGTKQGATAGMDLEQERCRPGMRQFGNHFAGCTIQARRFACL